MGYGKFISGGESLPSMWGANEEESMVLAPEKLNLLNSFLPMADSTVSTANADTMMNAGLKLRFKFA